MGKLAKGARKATAAASRTVRRLLGLGPGSDSALRSHSASSLPRAPGSGAAFASCSPADSPMAAVCSARGHETGMKAVAFVEAASTVAGGAAILPFSAPAPSTAPAALSGETAAAVTTSTTTASSFTPGPGAVNGTTLSQISPPTSTLGGPRSRDAKDDVNRHSASLPASDAPVGEPPPGTHNTRLEIMTPEGVSKASGQLPLRARDPNPPLQPCSSAAQHSRHAGQDGREKENVGFPSPAELSGAPRKLAFVDDSVLELQPPPVTAETELDPKMLAERAHHLRFIEEALDMARLALKINETPVGCVLVHNGKIIAKGMNATNVTRNGTRHAEAMALTALFSYPPASGPRTTGLRPMLKSDLASDQGSSISSESSQPDDGNQDGSKGHLYPYGQKLHPDCRVDPSIVRECVLYVTVEPCVMCASTLRQLGIKKVYFGAVNDKFGGAGGVFSIHANSLPVSTDGQTKSAHPTPHPVQLPDGSGTLGTSYPPGGGDGGDVESGFEIEGGWGRDEAVGLLRRFYVQENGRAPVPRKKEGRAARLAAMMEKDCNLDALEVDVDSPSEQNEERE